MTKNDFINLVAPIIQNENKKRNYPLFSSVVIGQACLETGFGASSLMMKAKAIFGIKASASWQGKVYNAKKKECYDGVNYTTINDSFRAYNSFEDSVEDYFKLITTVGRYRSACTATTPRACITAIKNGGYATDPRYIESVMNIINTYNLTKYDSHEVITGDIETLARDVINGKYGNGEERKQKLGSLYNEVQKRVNEILKGNQTTNEIIYIVKKGDCLCNIAKKYNTTVEKIAKDNGITNVDLILIGQKLIIRR